MTRYGEELLQAGGPPVQIRVGLNSGEVVVRSIGSDLHMDYTAVGQTTHLTARLEQLARPGAILLSADTLAVAEGYVQIKPLGAIPIKGVAATTINLPPRRAVCGKQCPQETHLHRRPVALTPAEA